MTENLPAVINVEVTGNQNDKIDKTGLYDFSVVDKIEGVEKLFHMFQWIERNNYESSGASNEFRRQFSGVLYQNQQNLEVEEIYFPRADEHIVLKRLKDMGLYKRSLNNGQHEIRCPFRHQTDDGAYYFEPCKSSPYGRYVCMHPQCANVNVSSFHNILRIRHIDARNKSIIRTKRGRITCTCDAAEIELSKSGLYYQRAPCVRIVVVSNF